MDTNTNSNLFELQIDHATQSYLRETAKWGKFLSIAGFIFCGLFVLIGIFAGSIFSTFGNTFGEQYGGTRTSMPAGLMGGMMAAVYIILALVYFFPCLFLFKFSTKMQVALRSNDQVQLNASFASLKSMFKFMGILTIIILGLYLLIFLLGGLGAALSGL